MFQGEKPKSLWGNATKKERVAYKSTNASRKNFWETQFINIKGLKDENKCRYFLDNFCSKKTKMFFNDFIPLELAAGNSVSIKKVKEVMKRKVITFAGNKYNKNLDKADLQYLIKIIDASEEDIKKRLMQVDKVTRTKYPSMQAADFRHSIINSANALFAITDLFKSEVKKAMNS